MDIVVVERHLSDLVEVEKDTLRKCIADIKTALDSNEKSMSLADVKSPKSPVLLGGSTVKAGEGRMMVLCVGKYSREGHFLTLSRQRLQPNLLKGKLEGLRNTIFLYFLAFSILYSVVILGENVEKALINGSLSNLL